MSSEFLVTWGIIIIASGCGWLMFDVLADRQQRLKRLESSVTEYYKEKRQEQENQKGIKLVKVLLTVLNLLVTFVAIFRFGKLLELEVGILGSLTLFWYSWVKKSWFLGSLMGMFTVWIAILGGDWVWLWLLTVIGAGFYQTGQKREKQNLLVQLGAVLNVVSAGENLWSLTWGKFVPETKFSQLPKTLAVETTNEGLVPCPICQETMKLFTIDDGKEKIWFDKCPKDKAIFFDDREYLWAILKSAVVSYQLPVNKNRVKKIDCPRCQVEMKVKRLAIDPEGIRVFQCPDCWGNLFMADGKSQ